MLSSAPANILALDQSTSATKSLVFAGDGRALARFSVEHRAVYPAPGHVEHDAEELYQNSLSVIASALQQFPGQIAALAITNQRETFVTFERATGKPLGNAVVWQCRRGDGVCRELAPHEALVARKTGLKIDSYFSAPKLTALLRAAPELGAKLADGSALFGTIDTYLIYRLTRGKTFATDPTNAARTLLYNIETLQWDQELCGLFGVPRGALAEVRDSTAGFGACDVPGHAAHGLAIAGVMGDSQAALFAHRCFMPGEAKVTLGTGSSILLNTGSRLPATGIRTIAWVHRGVPTYCLEGIISYSAATITWLRDQLGLIADAGETEPAARAVRDNGGVYLVPAFTGLSAPHWAPEARAAIVGLSAASTRNHVIRAALESIAYQIKDALESMKAEGGVELGILHADGGATQNRFLMQFIADLLGVKLVVSEAADYSPLGAAMAGWLATGVCGSLEELAGLRSAEGHFEPVMAREDAAALHAGWCKAVRQVLCGIEPGE